MAVAIDKYICPFCGKKALFVGVHDDEGNYKGRPGCEYESNPWSGLCYAIHHDGWGDCILCTDAHDLPLGGYFFGTAKEALKAIPTLTPPTIGHCKDCDNWNEQFSAGRKSLINYVCYCSEWSDPEIGYERYTLPNDYCSYFEPKKGMEDGKDRSI